MLILGSQSPRRKQILSYFSIPFIQTASNFDEESVPFQGDPELYAHTLSKAKAETLQPFYPRDLILTADTIVYCHGRLYGKPRHYAEAHQFFTELRGTHHTVLTSVTLGTKDRWLQAIEKTRVWFNPITDEQIDSYLKAIPYQDKSGGYSIEEGGSLLVNQIEGCFYNVMGLPVNALYQLLKQFDIDLWKHLKSL